MTENEVYTNEQMIDYMYSVLDDADIEDSPLINAIIQVIEEIQEFRKQGITIENALDTMCDLAGAEGIIEQYREIGTVDEFKALKEKSTKKSRVLNEGRYYCCNCGRPALASGHCVYCGRYLY